MRERIPSLPLSCKEYYYRSCQKNHTCNNPSFTFVQTALSHFITNQTRMHSLLLLPSQGRVRKQQWRDWLTDWLTVLLIFLPLKKFEASDSQLGKWGANPKKKDQRDRQTWQTCLAMGVAYESSCRTRSPIAMWGTCNSFASLLAYVPLPTPGHPRNTHCTPRPCSRTAAAYPKLARCCCCCTTSKPSRRLETALWKAEIHSRLLLTTTVIMLFSSPSNASNFSLSLNLRPTTTTIFLFSSPFPLAYSPDQKMVQQ